MGRIRGGYRAGCAGTGLTGRSVLAHKKNTCYYSVASGHFDAPPESVGLCTGGIPGNTAQARRPALASVRRETGHRSARLDSFRAGVRLFTKTNRTMEILAIVGLIAIAYVIYKIGKKKGEGSL